MQSCQIVSQSCIFSFNPCHVGFTNNLIALWNKTGIDQPAICDVKVALPTSHNRPQKLEGFATMVA